MEGYKTLWYDYDNDCVVSDKAYLDMEYRNYDVRVKKATVVGVKEAYNVVAYYTLKEGILPPLEIDIGIRILKHLKSIEKSIDVG